SISENNVVWNWNNSANAINKINLCNVQVHPFDSHMDVFTESNDSYVI
ncbi:10128_t:CDS:2, partial [Dentiscutata heterogama]